VGGEKRRIVTRRREERNEDEEGKELRLEQAEIRNREGMGTLGRMVVKVR